MRKPSLGRFGRIFTWLKKPIILSLVILLLAIVLVWFGGPFFAIGGKAFLVSVVSRVIVIIIIFLIWSFINLLVYTHRLKKTQEQPAVKAGEEAEAAKPVPVITGYEEQLNQSFYAVSRFSRKILPWHLVIGNFAAGKTALLKQATTAFKFPEGKKLTAVNVPDVCDWHLTKEKVFLELAEAGLHDETSVWKDVLGLLKRYRRKNPLRGVTIVCSVAELIQKTKEERKAYAGILRQRIYDLHRRLGIRIPITIVFSKADLIDGFSEFFEDLSEPEKQQIWGIRFSENVDIAEQFIAGFNDLIARINARLVTRLHQERDDKRAAIIAGFPLQLAALKPILQEFVQNVVLSAKFLEPVQLHGAFFVSALQAGTPIDLLVDAVAGKFNLAKTTNKAARRHSDIAYFAAQVFDAKYEAKAVRLTQKMQRQQRLLLIWGSAIGGLILIIGAIAWYAEYSSATAQVQQLRQTLNTPQDIEKWRQIDAEFTSWRQQHGIFGLYYPKKKFGVVVHNAYVHKLQEEFLPAVVYTLEQALQTDLQQPDALYPTLKAYLMFAYPEHMDANLVQTWMAQYWRQELGQDPNAQAKLNAELSDALSTPVPAMSLNNQLISQARNKLRQLSIGQIAYMNLKQQVNTQNPGMLSLYGDARDTFTQVFSYSGLTPQVSKFYTPDGLHQIYKKQYLDALKAILKGDWVLGKKGKVQDVTPQMEAQMQSLYYQDYIAEWEKVLSQIQIANCDSIAQMTQVLTILSSGDSPMVQILQQVNTNTNLSGSFLKKAADLAGKKQGKKEDVFMQQAKKVLPTHTTPVDNAFDSLHNLQLANIQKALTAVAAYMQNINNPKAAFQAAQDLMSGNTQNPLLQLLQQADLAPQPVNRWIQDIVQQSITLIFQQARLYIQEAWVTNVYPIYAQSLNERYPLNKAATQEINAADFGAFFGSKGIMDKFYQTYFQTFVQQQAGKLVWNTVDGVPIGFSDATLDMLSHVVFIKNAYFAGDGKKPSIVFTMKPLALDGSVASVDIIIGGKHFTYKHGPRYPDSVAWPGKGDDNSVTINFTSLNGIATSVIKQGDWGLLRLLDAYTVKPGGSPESYIWILTVGGRRATYLLQSASDYNPFNLAMLHGLSLPKVL